MKLLSMKSGNEDRGGILIDNEILDVSRAASLLLREGEAPPGAADEPFRDALDLFAAGSEWLGGLVGRVRANGTVAEEWRKSGALLHLDEVQLNPPILAPGKIFAVGLNYAAHASEQNIKAPEKPLIFTKNITALIGPNDPIQLPWASDQVDYEAELAFVIGKEARSIAASHALEHIAGYTIMNDVTARDLQARERQWARAKGLDTFAPCGPWLVTRDEIADPHALDIRLTINGEQRQNSNTSDLIFKIPELVEFISQDLTLRPGDIVTTGTPSGVGVFMTPPVYLQDGDQIAITIAGIGELVNPVRGRR